MMHLPALGAGEHMLLAGYSHDVPRARLPAPHVRRPREVQGRTAPAAHETRTQQWTCDTKQFVMFIQYMPNNVF